MAKQPTVKKLFLSLDTLREHAEAAKAEFDRYCIKYRIGERASLAASDAQWRRVYTPTWRRRRDKMWNTDRAYCDTYNTILAHLSD